MTRYLIKSGVYFVFLLAFATQYAMRMRRIILSSVISLAVPYFPTLSYKMAKFSGKNILRQNECSDFFYNYDGNSSCYKKSYIKNYSHKCTNVI